MTSDELTLTDPTEQLREAYMDFLAEFESAGESSVDGNGRDLKAATDFAAFVQKLHDDAMGVGLPDGYVPGSTYWLVRGRCIIGVCNIRHSLTERLRDFGGHIGYSVRPSERSKGYATKMLAMALAKARQLGIDHVLVTCAKNNPASARVIQRNGGVMDGESYSQQGGCVTQRHWIDLATGAKDNVSD